MSLVCNSCGRIIESLPLQCEHSININNETKQWECTLGDCGSVTLEKFLCENCCINKSILKIYDNYELLSVENQEFRQELDLLKRNFVQMNILDSGFKFWVKFGDGEFKYGKGEIDGANFSLSCSHETMNGILIGDHNALGEVMNGNLKVEGDLQYAVVYFDLLNLALEINKEVRGA